MYFDDDKETLEKNTYNVSDFSKVRDNLENKIKTTIGQKQSNYIIDRLFAANNQISDIYTGTKASKILHKVETKAITDWGSMHKIQDFLLKPSFHYNPHMTDITLSL